MSQKDQREEKRILIESLRNTLAILGEGYSFVKDKNKLYKSSENHLYNLNVKKWINTTES